MMSSMFCASHVRSILGIQKLKEWLFLQSRLFPQPVTLLQLCGPDMAVIYPVNFSGNDLSKLNLTTYCKQLTMNHA